MNLCDVMVFMRWTDWAAWALMLILGSWKLFELIVLAGKWAERKITEDKK